ncbi:glycosyltransferase family 2 protein [Streptomyces sp. NPDC093109]|uniref:glycosyltransferase family 2 protein n=1 Tax=Streptomyces sp. NPDC093109 TaxID=3154977 RepID=UPI00345011C5
MTARHRPFSVVICVYTEDRWDDIRAAVGSVRRQSLPALETLLVVDHHPALLARLVREYEKEAARGEVRVLPNAGPRGLSAGRNTGIAVARGEIVAFLDDDAVAERDWLRVFDEAYDGPGAGGRVVDDRRVLAVGGRTVPAWASGARPAWFPEEFDWVVGCTYRGLPEGRVRVRNVLGGNASFRRTVFDTVGGFATGIGRDGDKRPLGGEETELCIRLTDAVPDATLLIDDRAVIHHRVPHARERFGYFCSRTYAEGLSKALVARSVGADKGLASERRYTTRVLPAGIARGLRDGVRGRPGGFGRAGAIVAGVALAAAGYLVGRYRTRGGGGSFTSGPITSGPAVTSATVTGATVSGSTVTGSTAVGSSAPGVVASPSAASPSAASPSAASPSAASPSAASPSAAGRTALRRGAAA